jgi:FkbM family methyltransferase
MTIGEEVRGFVREASKWIDPALVRVALDVGSLDGEVTRRMLPLFPAARVFAFECNPDALGQCRAALAGLDRARLVERAVCDVDGDTVFHPIDGTRTRTPHADGNIGASSLYLASGDYPHEQYVQGTICVPATRLDTWARGAGVDAVDVLWMDVQGAELRVLRGMGELLRTVRIIHTEVEFRSIYSGQALFPEVDGFLRAAGFVQRATMYRDEWFGNLVYVRAELERRPLFSWLASRRRVRG